MMFLGFVFSRLSRRLGEELSSRAIPALDRG